MIRAWRADASGAATVDPAEAVKLAMADAGTVWIDFDCEEQATLEQLLAPLQVHPLAIEDMVQQINRPKVDNYGSYLYVVMHSARWEQDDKVTLREIDILVGERFIVTYHDGTTRSVASAHEVLPRRPEILAKGPAEMLHFLLDVLVDHYLPIMDQLADEIDQLEHLVFRAADREAHSRILRLKRGMAALRRVVGPERDTVLALTRDEFRPIPAEVRPYLRDVFDRLARVNDLLDTLSNETMIAIAKGLKPLR